MSSRELIKKMLSGDKAALARVITLVENRSNGHLALMAEIQKHCGQATTIGVTGPPGSGKSTLVDKLTKNLRAEGKKIGIVAIDPSSPFSGGAVLGDRIRMQDHATDEAVFIRSLGSRGSRGGLSRATREVVKLYDAFGMDIVIVETVGVGQTELDIMEVADTTLVVLTPESGDTIQTMKAGILEIADIFVVNKADRDGAGQIQAELMAMLQLGEETKKRGEAPSGGTPWKPPVLLVQATKEIGIGELLQEIRRHEKSRSGPEKGKKRKALFQEEAREILLDELRPRLQRRMNKEGVWENPYELVAKILAKINL
ncbi:MAG: methylmalonyl Co-A mutase-associated GTPase MeaB [Deltaproteobacteria bacterium]|nr:methylmalonyl Co-A mutase-associated GTPase MeaB [Deltaproteobacteria bacterium]